MDFFSTISHLIMTTLMEVDQTFPVESIRRETKETRGSISFLVAVGDENERGTVLLLY